jgi:hypothetical protein
MAVSTSAPASNLRQLILAPVVFSNRPSAWGHLGRIDSGLVGDGDLVSREGDARKHQQCQGGECETSMDVHVA